MERERNRLAKNSDEEKQSSKKYAGGLKAQVHPGGDNCSNIQTAENGMGR